jgi:integrase
MEIFNGHEALAWLAEMQELASGCIRLELEGYPTTPRKNTVTGNPINNAVSNAVCEIKGEITDHEAEIRSRERILHPGGVTLHQAFDHYIEYVRAEYREVGTKELTSFGQNEVYKTQKLKDTHADLPLAHLGKLQLEAFFAHWRGRPPHVRTGLPITKGSAESMMCTLKRFLTRLDEQEEVFGWRLPFRRWPRGKIRMAPEEIAALHNPHQVKTYSPSEIGHLWEYADSRSRALMVVSLNCGFGIGDIGTLRLDEIHLEGDRGPWVGHVRIKTGVYGEWPLWPESVDAIQYLLQCHGGSTSPYLVPGLVYRTPSGWRSSAITSAWRSLAERIIKDYASFPSYTFNKLRKTSANLVRSQWGGEIAAAFLCHKRVGSDPLVENYSNKRFGRVGDATEWLRGQFLPYLTVASPFPDQPLRSYLSRRTIERIGKLRSAGYTIRGICQELGICRESVRKYSQKAKVQQ